MQSSFNQETGESSTPIRVLLDDLTIVDTVVIGSGVVGVYFIKQQNRTTIYEYRTRPQTSSTRHHRRTPVWMLW